MHELAVAPMTIKFSRIALTVIALVLQASLTFAQTPYEVENDQLKINSLKSNSGHRLLIEWLNPVKVLQKKTDRQLILRFSRPMAINAESIFGRLRTYLDVSRTKIEGTDLTLTLQPDTTANLEIKKKRVVVINLSRASSPSPNIKIDVEAQENGVRLIFNWPNLSKFEATNEDSNLSVTFRSDINLEISDLAYLNETFKPWFSKVQSTDDISKTKLIFALQPMIASSTTDLGNNQVAIDFFRDASLSKEVPDTTWLPAFRPPYPDLKKTSSKNPQQHLPMWRPRVMTSSNADQEDAGIEVSSSLKKSKITKDLVFDWEQDVGAAVFKRAGYLWVVFDAPVRSSRLPIPPPSPYQLGSGEVIKEEHATIIRFPMLSEANINITNQGGQRWTIQLNAAANSRYSIPIMSSDQPSVLTATAPSKGHIVEIMDPIVGDQIGIWPVSQSHLGQQDRRRFVDLDILPSIQGLVWRKRNDDLDTNTTADGIKFNSPQGLMISNWLIDDSSKDSINKQKYDIKKASNPSKKNLKSKNVENEKKGTMPSSFFDLAGFHLGQANTKENRRILRQSIGNSSPREQDNLRLDLARLLVAEQHTAEARTVLSNLSTSIVGAMAISERALKGASFLLDGNIDEASSLLDADEFDQDDEIGIWRAAVDSLNEDWEKAAPIWKANRNTLDIYPPRLRMKFGLLALEAAIRSNDDNMIRVGFRRLKSLDPKPRNIAQIDRLYAMRAIRDGDSKRAEEILQSLVKRKLGTFSLQADLELASLILGNEANNLDLLETLDDRLPLWRGHPQEIKMIDSLARWHREAYKPRKALDLWERLSVVHPKTDADTSLQERRKATYTEAINELAGNKLSLFDAYSIYLDFLNLLPEEPGKKTLHLSLARHLTNLDLLSEAIELLRPILNRAVDGSEREQTGTKLAELLLAIDRPHEVLSVLDRSTAIDSHDSRGLIPKRQLIRARALVRLDRNSEALEQIRDVQTSSARHLRAEIFWKQREWARLASVIESFLSDPGLVTPLSYDDQKLVLWLALSWDQLGLTDRLADLRKSYIDEIASSPWSEAFMLTTQVESKGGDIPSVLADTDQHLDKLKKFRSSIETKPQN